MRRRPRSSLSARLGLERLPQVQERGCQHPSLIPSQLLHLVHGQRLDLGDMVCVNSNLSVPDGRVGAYELSGAFICHRGLSVELGIL